MEQNKNEKAKERKAAFIVQKFGSRVKRNANKT